MSSQSPECGLAAISVVMMQEVPLDQWRQDAHTFRGFEEQRSRGSLGGGETFSSDKFIKYFLNY